MLSAAQIATLIDAELARIADPTCREALRSCLVAPRVEQREWEYGEADEVYPCWIVAVASERDVLLAHCEQGFGPEHPWGAVSVRDPGIGMDSQWHRSLETAFRRFIWHFDQSRRT